MNEFTKHVIKQNNIAHLTPRFNRLDLGSIKRNYQDTSRYFVKVVVVETKPGNSAEKFHKICAKKRGSKPSKKSKQCKFAKLLLIFKSYQSSFHVNF